ncbi:MAG: 2-dehydropantoate 2-reductase N-terminal domain-containing protein [Chloroflexota bacterium]
MNITILGAGAMGSLFGGRLALFEHDVNVQLLDVNQAHIDAINNDGLQLDVDEGVLTVNVPAIRPEEVTTTPDLLIVFTKTFHTQEALASVQHLIIV